MSNEITTKLEELPSLPKAALCVLWQELFGKSGHPKLRREMMIPILAYRIQEKAYGGLKQSTRKRLERVALELGRDPKAKFQAPQQIKTGTKLLRQWRGETHNVIVVDDWFDYRNKRYRSLSEIARLITGTRWSGPSFFGLKQPRTGKARPGQ